MGVLDRFLDAIKLNDDYDDEDYLKDDDLMDGDDDEDFLEEEPENRPKKRFMDIFGKKNTQVDESDEEEAEEQEDIRSSSGKSAPQTDKPSRTSSKITPMRSSSRRSGSSSSNVEVCVIRPTKMDDSKKIADTLAENCAVILSLEGIDMELAQRIIDFTSGACYLLDGSVKQISSYIFVLGSSNVDITGDLSNILGGVTPSVRAGY